MKFLENDLETILYEASKTEEGRTRILEKEGPHITNPLFKQVDLKDYGRCDLMHVEYDPYAIYINIFELKKEQVDKSAVLQLLRYIKGMKIWKKSTSKFRNLDCQVGGILIGKSINIEPEFIKVINLIYSEIELYTYGYGIDGIEFQKNPSPEPRRTTPKNSKDLKEIIENPLTKYLKGAEKHFNETILFEYQNY